MDLNAAVNDLIATSVTEEMLEGAFLNELVAKVGPGKTLLNLGQFLALQLVTLLSIAAENEINLGEEYQTLIGNLKGEGGSIAESKEA